MDRSHRSKTYTAMFEHNSATKVLIERRIKPERTKRKGVDPAGISAYRSRQSSSKIPAVWKPAGERSAQTKVGPLIFIFYLFECCMLLVFLNGPENTRTDIIVLGQSSSLNRDLVPRLIVCHSFVSSKVFYSNAKSQ